MSSSVLRQACTAAALTILACLAGPALAQDASPYKEGNVVEVTSVLTKPGMFDEYMRFLAGPYTQQQEGLKKLGVVVSYGFYATAPRHAGDPDLYLTVTYANMAALDGLEEKSEAISSKIFGNRKQAAQGSADREAMRTILGSELIRELKLK